MWLPTMDDEEEIEQVPALDFAAWRKARAEAKTRKDPFPQDLFPTEEGLNAHCTVKLDVEVSVRLRRASQIERVFFVSVPPVPTVLAATRAR